MRTQWKYLVPSIPRVFIPALVKLSCIPSAIAFTCGVLSPEQMTK